MNPKSVTVNEIINDFGLNVLIGDEKSLKRQILVPEINRPGLELVGFYKYTNEKKLLVFGNKEIAYFKTIEDTNKLKEIYYNLFKEITPCLIVCHGHTINGTLESVARELDFPVLQYAYSTNELTSSLFTYLLEKLAPAVAKHGTLLNIHGMGVMLTGPSGIGKSEVAMALIKKGHQLISDDRVDIIRVGQRLIGSAPNISEGLMEVRGIGIIDIRKLFGINCVKKKMDINYIINLKPLTRTESFERLGTQISYENIFGVNVPLITLPVSEGRNVADIIEVAVANMILKEQGFDSAIEFEKRINDLLKGN